MNLVLLLDPASGPEHGTNNGPTTTQAVPKNRCGGFTNLGVGYGDPVILFGAPF